MAALRELPLWLAFHAVVALFLGAELYFNRGEERVSPRHAAAWTTGWILLALAWGGLVYGLAGYRPTLEFLTGYVVELSLSVDNVFVFVVVFTYFGVPREHRYRVLLWGVLGALLMRGMLIAAGTFLIHRFEWILYVFGAFLVVTGIRMARGQGHEVEPSKNPVLQAVRRQLRMTDDYHGSRFFVRTDRGWAATPMVVTLVAIETTDVLFALDSIPAIFGVTREPFLVYSSNILAVACLRSLYFVLEAAVERFRFLSLGLAAVLVFIGGKLLVEDLVKVPILASLVVVLAILGTSVIASIWVREFADD